MNGADAGRSAITGRDGPTAFADVGRLGCVGLSDGLQHGVRAVSLKGVDARVNVALLPRGRVLSEFTGKVCGQVPPDYSWLLCAVTTLETRHTFVVHRSGTIAFDVAYDYIGDCHPNSLGIEILCGSETIVAAVGWKFGRRGVRFQLLLDAERAAASPGAPTVRVRAQIVRLPSG